MPRIVQKFAAYHKTYFADKEALVYSGGDDGIRTRGLRLAKPALSQLSYIPTNKKIFRLFPFSLSTP